MPAHPAGGGHRFPPVQGKLPFPQNWKSPQVVVLGMQEFWTFPPGALLLGLRAGPRSGDQHGGCVCFPSHLYLLAETNWTLYLWIPTGPTTTLKPLAA